MAGMRHGVKDGRLSWGWKVERLKQQNGWAVSRTWTAASEANIEAEGRTREDDQSRSRQAGGDGRCRGGGRRGWDPTAAGTWGAGCTVAVAGAAGGRQSTIVQCKRPASRHRGLVAVPPASSRRATSAWRD